MKWDFQERTMRILLIATNRHKQLNSRMNA